MMYIGGGYALDSWGRKYDMKTGEDRFAVLDSEGNMELHETEEILWKSFIDDVFFCLRPTQAYRDINALSNN